MNYKLILKIIGLILVIEAGLMLLPLLIDFLYNDGDRMYFIYTLVPSGIIGACLFGIKCEKKNIHAREGYLIVAIAWIVLSAVAAVPFVISGYIPNYLDAIFETVSGFTTTGASAMDDVEILSHSMQFWRIFTNWVGGMGILVFMLAISPVAGKGTAIHILRAESPGPVTEKISPKISTTAKYLYFIYIALTLIQTGLLVVTGLPLFNSFLVSFGTMATGGFSFLNTSMAALSLSQQTITTVFMVLAGINFSLFFLLVTGKILSAILNEELLTYLAVFFVAVILVTINVSNAGCFNSVGEAIHHVAFSIASIITTTGYSSCEMGMWPAFSINICLLLMFFGACAGSTAGGIKISRIGMAYKGVKGNLKRLMHPRSVIDIRYNGKEVPKDVLYGVAFYIVLFAIIYCISMVIVSIDPAADFQTAFASVNTTINNNGIGFFGAYGSFSKFAWYSKVTFIMDMLIGRLEIFPIIILLNSIISPAKVAVRLATKKLSGNARKTG